MQKSVLFALLFFTIPIYTVPVMQLKKEVLSLKALCLKHLAATSEDSIITAITTSPLPNELQAELFNETFKMNTNILYHPGINFASINKLLTHLSPEACQPIEKKIAHIIERPAKIQAINPTTPIFEWQPLKTIHCTLSHAQNYLQIKGLQSRFKESNKFEQKIVIAACREKLAMHRNKHPNHCAFAMKNLADLKNIYIQHTAKKRKTIDPVFNELFSINEQKPKKQKGE